MRQLQSLLIAVAMFLIPASAFAEISIADNLPIDDAIHFDFALDDVDANIAQPGPGPGPGPRPMGPGPRPMGPAPRPMGPGPVGPAPRPMSPAPRPIFVRPAPAVVVVDNPSTVVIDDNDDLDDIGSVFGFGIRGVGVTNSPAKLRDYNCEVANNISGGVGFYLKARPVRYFSIEFINDYILGSYDTTGDYRQSADFLRIPVVLGLRGHFLDYGVLDFYAAAAASASFIIYDDNYSDSFDFVQWGAQVGLGLSLIAGIFEVGIDLRYTIEEAPDHLPNDYEVDHKTPIHGFLFALNVGFAI